MKLQEYLEKFDIDIVTFSVQCKCLLKGKNSHLSYYAVCNALYGKPIRQRTAIIIEHATGGLVTVKELRGFDERDRPPKIKRPRGRPWKNKPVDQGSS